MDWTAWGKKYTESLILDSKSAEKETNSTGEIGWRERSLDLNWGLERIGL